MSVISDQIEKLIPKVHSFASADGILLGEVCENAVKPILLWEEWYRSVRTNSSAVELLDGLRAAVRETVGLVALGLGRSATASIRLQVDLILSYTYFAEHPVEWRQVCESGEGFRLKASIFEYHEQHQRSFRRKLAIIENASGCSLDQCYKVLSAHIHGQSSHTTPKIESLDEMVMSKDWLLSLVELQRRAAIAVSNFLLTVHSSEWQNLPAHLIEPAETLLKPNARDRATFFA